MRKLISFVLVLLLVMGMNVTVFADVSDPSNISDSGVATGPALETVTKGAADLSTEDGIKGNVTQNTQGISGSLPIKKLDTVPVGYERIMATAGGVELVSTNFCISDIEAVDNARFVHDDDGQVLYLDLVNDDATLIEVEGDNSVEVLTLQINLRGDTSKLTLSNINNNELEVIISSGESADITIDGTVTIQKMYHKPLIPGNQNLNKNLNIQGINNGVLNILLDIQMLSSINIKNVSVSNVIVNTKYMFLHAIKQITVSNSTLNAESLLILSFNGNENDRSGDFTFNNCTFNSAGGSVFSSGKLTFNECQGTLKSIIGLNNKACPVEAAGSINFNMNLDEELRIETTRDIGPFNENTISATNDIRALSSYENILLSKGTGVYSLEDEKLSIRKVEITPVFPYPETSVYSATYSDGTVAESVVIKGVLGEKADKGDKDINNKTNVQGQPQTSDTSMMYIWIMGIIVSAFVLLGVFRKVYR